MLNVNVLYRRKSSLWGVLLCVGIVIYRLSVLYLGHMNLHFDEAQYWLWSHHLDWGYFSKPPMIAWAIYGQRFFFGDSEFALKVLSLCVYIISSCMIYLICRIRYDRAISLGAALLFFTMPAVSLSSFIISTDVFLILFWILALWQVVKALEFDDRHWLWAGFFAGCGLLTKYTMVLFLPSLFLFAGLGGRLNAFLKNRCVLLAMLIAFCMLLPNLLWNASHDMVSFGHLYEISQVEKKRLHFSELFAFLGAQFGVFGLFSSVLLIRYCLWDYNRALQDRYGRLWLSLFVVFLGVICMQAFLSRAFANWAAPSYVAASIWLSVVLCQRHKSHLLALAIAVNLVTMGLMYHYEMIYQVLGVELTKKTDPMRMIRHWDTLGREVSLVSQSYPDHIILTENRKILGELIYYVKPRPFNAQIFNPSHAVKNYFQHTQDLNQYKDRQFLWVSREQSTVALKPYFNVIEKVDTILIPSYQQEVTPYYVYRLSEFSGY
ncbi:MAG: glycosyltransferase family 39 protein [Pseudomonadota bacterium]|nr:glycosyltransferase family 39 protein [Pseudomonadota bacterium]